MVLGRQKTSLDGDLIEGNGNLRSSTAGHTVGNPLVALLQPGYDITKMGRFDGWHGVLMVHAILTGTEKTD